MTATFSPFTLPGGRVVIRAQRDGRSMLISPRNGGSADNIVAIVAHEMGALDEPERAALVDVYAQVRA